MLSLVAALLMGQTPCGPLDLRTALDLAARRSDEVAIKQAEAATADVDVALAKAIAFLPQSSLQFVFGPSPGATGSVTDVLSGSSVGLTNVGAFGRIDAQLLQPLWTWGQLTGARDAAKAGLRARQHLVDDTLSQVQLRVIQLYWGDALARRFLAIAAEVEKALVDVDAHITKSLKDETGDVTPQDKYQVALFRSQLSSRKADAQQAQELARIGLAATLALPRDRLVLKETTLEAEQVAVPSVAQALEQAELDRPDLRALSAAIDAKRAEVQIKNGAMYPQLFVAGELSAAYADNRTWQTNPWVSDPFNELSLGAVLGIRQDLGIPAMIEQKRKTESELRALERQQIGLKRLIDTQVESAVAELTAAQARAKAAESGFIAGRAWFHAAGLDFEANVGDAKSLLLAYKGYVESQVSSAQSAYDVLVAKAKLAQATAMPLGPAPTGEAQCTLP